MSIIYNEQKKHATNKLNENLIDNVNISIITNAFKTYSYFDMYI